MSTGARLRSKGGVRDTLGISGKIRARIWMRARLRIRFRV